MREYFSDTPKILYEGPSSKNPLAYKYYNPKEMVGDKSMEDHLRFSVAFWHTFTGMGLDPFGQATMLRPWSSIEDPMEEARVRIFALFEFLDKLGIEYFCFHDRDIAPEGKNLRETNRNLDTIVSLIKDLMEEREKKLLWGTANLFANPRYVHGAATSCNADVFAYAGAQVKKALEVTKELNGEGYTFWGGREGYETLLNTDLALELDNLARFLEMAVEYAESIGFTGQFYIEPKPKEPTKHQYDFDVASVISFLSTYQLKEHFKCNIEANHATLAAHTLQHELYLARINSMLGSVDANQGDLLLGWDTDQFPTDIYTTTMAMYEILKNGGLHQGGLNFDAKVRRASFEPSDLFYAHIAGMDAFAKGLKIAYGLLTGGELEEFIKERYHSYQEGIGKKIISKEVGFVELEEYSLAKGEVVNSSGHQEMLEALVNQYILE